MTPLHHFGNFLRTTLMAVPMPLVRVLFLGLLVAICIWVLLLPKSAVTDSEGRSRGPGGNLRFWAITALLIQIAIYSIL